MYISMFMYSNLDLSDLAFELFRLFSRHSWRKANVTKLDSCGETQSGDCAKSTVQRQQTSTPVAASVSECMIRR